MAIIKSKSAESEQQLMDQMNTCLNAIYSNKSSTEYKSKGDITASSEYGTIERMVSDLKVLKGFSRSEADDIRMLFLTLHRPIFKKMVMEYLTKPNERNTTFTTVYTVGYRLLVGELSRIFSSTEATDKGISYKPDKISRKENAKWLIKHFNTSLEQKIDTYIRSHGSKKTSIQEASLDGVASIIGTVGGVIVTVFDILGAVFRGAKELNPISLINAILTRSYDKKVEKFETIAAMYNASKDAYDEYMKLPASQRKEKIESKYVKNIEKYNIKMQNLAAQIEHYDQRAQEEVKDAKASRPSTKSEPKPDTDTGDTSTSTSTEDTGGFDF